MSDLEIIIEALLREHRTINARGPEYIPDMKRVAQRIEFLMKKRDKEEQEAHEDALDTVTQTEYL